MNRSLRAILLAVLAVALAPPLARGAPQADDEETPVPPSERRGPSTPAERKKALTVTRRLEKDPLGKGAAADRRWLFEWIVAIPDVNVKSCSGPLDFLVEQQGTRHARELYVQSVFGMAAYIIEHPKKQAEDLDVQRAGVESTLRAYRSLIERDPANRWPALDELLAAQKAGKLAEVVKQQVDCSGGGGIPEDAI